MHLIPADNSVVPVGIEYIAEMIQIAESCNLSIWTSDDYIDEINRTDSFGFVHSANRHNAGDQTKVICGFILARLIRNFCIVPEENSKESSKTDNFSQIIYTECEILNIAVQPVAQKKGVGQKLIDATVAECFHHGVRVIWLEVRKYNENSIKFYRRNKFDTIYTRKSYYRNPVEDALVMKAELSYPSFYNSAKI